MSQHRSAFAQRAILAPRGPDHLVWLLTGALLGFLLPFVFADLLRLQRDVYYLLYFAGAGAFLALYFSAAGYSLLTAARRLWLWGVVVGLAVVAFNVAVVLGEDATEGPSGAELLFQVLWRGVVYGVVDALLLIVFPVVAVLKAAEGTFLRRRWLALPLLWLLCLAAVELVTVAYHLGYPDFRSGLLWSPVLGSAVMGMAFLVAANPLAPLLGHIALHVAAVLHAFETDVFLPPHY